MNRVHGNTKIRRREQVEQLFPYEKYREYLRNDFGKICGYCGKSELVAKSAFEIDHFIPKRLAPERENDYYNLVYSCHQCNRKKGGKWISEDKNIQFVNGRGFIDPATEDFDLHLQRDEDGNIVGKTPAGKYMVEIGLEFNKRPIKEIYKAMQLVEKKHHLEEKIKNLSDEEKDHYIKISMTLEQLLQRLFETKE